MARFIDAVQGSDAWLKSRIGVLTGSRMADAMATTKTGESEKRKAYKLQILSERMTGLAEEFYVNSAMQWGTGHEAEAREMYEEISGNIVTECSLCFHDTIGSFAASPDGLVGHDGLVEIKAPNSTTHIKWMLDGTVPDQHKPQMLAQLAVTGRKWCDFISYDPRFPAPHNAFIVRFTPTPEEIAAVETAALQFLGEVVEMHLKIIGAIDKEPVSETCPECGFKKFRHAPVCPLRVAA